MLYIYIRSVCSLYTGLGVTWKDFESSYNTMGLRV